MPESVMDSIKQAWTEGEKATETKTEPTVTETQADEWDAPTDWAHEERETFRQFAPEARKFALTKYNSVAEKYKDHEAFQSRYKPFDDLFRQYEPHFGGLKPYEATQRVFNQLAYANGRPKDFVRDFVKSMKLDPREIFEIQPQQTQADPNAYQDPEIAALKAEIQRLSSGIQETQAQMQERLQREQAQRDAAWAKEIEDFRGSKGQDGKPKAPYFGEVEGHMAALLKSGVARNLQDAYDQAVYANPTVRAKVLADQKASERREAERKEREHAEKAKQAGASVTSGASRSEAAPQSKQRKGESVMASIRRAEQELASRNAA